ncbi:MAG: heavy metal translocating P-type ATPase [Myxococcales bacterium]|nr:heavy metal translocating P-type ATPase [Myxococcales bacterium]
MSAVAAAQASSTPGCSHCGLSLPAGVTPSEAGLAFCCAGCETVYEVLRDQQLGHYYDIAGVRAPARSSGRSYAEFDDPAFHKLYVTVAENGLARTSLFLEDLRCAACVWLVEQAPTQLDGVSQARADIGRSRLDLVFDPTRTALSAIARRLDRVGHPAHPYRGIDRDLARRKEDRALLLRIGVAGAVVGNVMLLAIALYAGWLSDMNAQDTQFFRMLSMIATVPTITYAAMPFFRGAWTALRQRRLHLDFPLAVGIAAGLGWGTLNVLRGTGEIYFDTVAMLVFLLLLARWVQARHYRRASTSAEMLLGLTSSRVRRVIGADDATIDAPIEAIHIGDAVVVHAGETIPVDGVIRRGSSALDMALLTGESQPVDVAVGATVFAGTLNVAAPLTIVATSLGEETRVGQLVARIDEQHRRRSRVEQMVDRVSGRFVAVVFAVAILTFVAHGVITSWSAGAEHAMALLIVTCPCALALATPLAVSFALGRAARRGILIKGADALERLATPGTVVLDKTGTLTHGKLTVVAALPHRDDLPAVAALEVGMSHPVARALAAAASPHAAGAVDVAQQTGRGVTGTVDGQAYVVGAPAWVLSQATMSSELARAMDEAARRGETPVLVAKGGAVSSVILLSDPLRADAAPAVARLRMLGWRVKICSGDAPHVVAHVAAALAVAPADCQGGATPEAKLATIEALRANGPVVMVGDGVNDAAALAAATCGIAVHGSADASIEAADVFVRTAGLAPVASLVHSASLTMRVIRRNFAISTFYNVIMGGLAVLGVIHPLWAAILMPLSSLTVLASSTRTNAFGASTWPPTT